MFVSSANAQGHGGFAGGAGGHAGMGAFRGGGGRGSFSGARRGRRYFIGAGYWPYYDWGYDSEAGMSEGPPPPPYFAEPPVPPAPPLPPAESEVLELQGDQWVRLTNYGASQIAGQLARPESERAMNLGSGMSPARRTQAVEPPPSELPPAVLVYRDGHKEEIRKYVIAGATLYTNSDYWSSGSWTRKVPISELDVRATLAANQERGAKFSLPSGPNEVMMRP
jgi:hypothetical protein